MHFPHCNCPKIANASCCCFRNRASVLLVVLRKFQLALRFRVRQIKCLGVCVFECVCVVVCLWLVCACVRVNQRSYFERDRVKKTVKPVLAFAVSFPFTFIVIVICVLLSLRAYSHCRKWQQQQSSMICKLFCQIVDSLSLCRSSLMVQGTRIGLLN